ncbi:hypothetical protein [Woodsholea maritima]|uniref:hypothetical protein n=1 Tax=Woodsholea maritima TaxID=240237 RepID=UPI000362AA62|nr:hypothetical protein [Woodsholea maritima]
MEALNENRCLELIEAYGANLARWPEGERAAGKVRLDKPSPAILRAMEEARGLDRLLSFVPLPLLSPLLTRRVIALYERERSQPRWAPLAAAATLLIGVSLGWMGAASDPLSAAEIGTEIPVYSALDVPQTWLFEDFS